MRTNIHVTIFNIMLDNSLCLNERMKDRPLQFLTLNNTKKRFNDGIIPAVFPTGHTFNPTERFNLFHNGLTSELATLVTVKENRCYGKITVHLLNNIRKYISVQFKETL